MSVRICRHTVMAAAFAVAADKSYSAVELTRTGGVLGEAVGYLIEGHPNAAAVLLISLSDGPTPLSLFDPFDHRTLSVGLELAPAWWIGQLEPSGAKEVTYALPLLPSLQGVALHAQAVTLAASGPHLVDELSNATTVQLSEHGKNSFTVHPPLTSTGNRTATRLNDGTVLLAGGIHYLESSQITPVASLELFDPQTQAFLLLPASMQHARSGHSATLLSDGRVLLLGGRDGSGAICSTGDIWDPTTNMCSAIVPMSKPRFAHSACRLSDGRVLVSGGWELEPQISWVPPYVPGMLDECEIYDSTTNTWSSVSNLPVRMAWHDSFLLPDNRIMVVGGAQLGTSPHELPSVNPYYRFLDVITMTWSAPMPLSGAYTDAARIKLESGEIFQVGGRYYVGASAWMPSDDVYKFDHSSGYWIHHSKLPSPRAACQLEEWKFGFIALGGNSAWLAEPVIGIAVYNNVVGSWSEAAKMLAWRPWPIPTAIDDGERILITGLPTISTQLTAELCVP